MPLFYLYTKKMIEILKNGRRPILPRSSDVMILKMKLFYRSQTKIVIEESLSSEIRIKMSRDMNDEEGKKFYGFSKRFLGEKCIYLEGKLKALRFVCPVRCDNRARICRKKFHFDLILYVPCIILQYICKPPRYTMFYD